MLLSVNCMHCITVKLSQTFLCPISEERKKNNNVVNDAMQSSNQNGFNEN